MESQRSNKNISKEVKQKELAYRTPWAIKDEKAILFRTTANTYGSYYRYHS